MACPRPGFLGSVSPQEPPSAHIADGRLTKAVTSERSGGCSLRPAGLEGLREDPLLCALAASSRSPWWWEGRACCRGPRLREHHPQRPHLLTPPRGTGAGKAPSLDAPPSLREALGDPAVTRDMRPGGRRNESEPKTAQSALRSTF